jgi:RNA polymerase sigma-70 factor (ECF subfamily)
MDFAHLPLIRGRLIHVLGACLPLLHSTPSPHAEPVGRTSSSPPLTVGVSRDVNPPKDAERQLDAELLRQVAAGDEAAYARLYDRFSPGLYSLVFKMVRDEKEAEDILQEGFTHIWRRATTYDPARSSAFTWAVMVFRNKAIDRLRVRQRRERTVVKAAGDTTRFPESDVRSAETPALHEQQRLVRSALEQIPSDQKQAVELAFFGGLTHEQIAARLATPLGTIKARIRRGLLRLRDCLKEVA